MKNKKAVLSVGVIALVLLVIGGVWISTRSSSQTEAEPQATARPRISMPINQLAIDQRPYITLEPTLAREVRLTIVETVLKSEAMDYELQYSSGDREEAAIGEIPLRSFPSSKVILLGSQSGGGKISYHEEVTGGSLVTTFFDENYKLSNDWTYVINSPARSSFESRDGKFSVEFARPYAGRYLILFQNPGFPSIPEGDVVSGMYSFAGVSSIQGLEARVSIFASLSPEGTKLLGWNGTQWVELETTVADGNTLVYSGPFFEGFVVVR